MEFKFNFGADEDDSNTDSFISSKEFTCSDKNLRKCCKHDSQENTPSQYSDTKDFNEITPSPSMKLWYLKPELAESIIKYNRAVAENSNSKDISTLLDSSDLESGEYEGGFKLWECTIDLLNYVQAGKVAVENKSVLDLGCGSGVLGAHACLLGAERVCLQDYNSEVIDHFTIPSVRQTLAVAEKNKNLIHQCLFLSGDWTAVCEYFHNNDVQKFDVILSSETIYNVKYYDKLRVVLENHLHEEGVALFGAKIQYFGVGGGVREFMRYLEGTNLFDVKVVERIDDHLQREIVQVKKKMNQDLTSC